MNYKMLSERKVEGYSPTRIVVGHMLEDMQRHQ